MELCRKATIRHALHFCFTPPIGNPHNNPSPPFFPRVKKAANVILGTAMIAPADTGLNLDDRD
jgi:hypothetical protein